MKYWLIALLVLVYGRLLAQSDSDSGVSLAARHFATINRLCATPAAQLWGCTLAGPVLLVDPVTRRVFANQPDTQGLLQAVGAVYSGKLPLSVNIANTATQWAGVPWTMLMLPLPTDQAEQEKLMAHELFHRVQPALGFAGASPVCDHLDSEAGRMWFRLELAALAAAWRSQDRIRRQHLQRASWFRAWRYQRFPAARQVEEALEWNEGLAEFTGVYVSGIAAQDTSYLPGLADSATVLFPSFARSFAYLTGPVYGMLLSQIRPGWQQVLQAGDRFPALLAKYYQLSKEVPNAARVQAAAKYYAGDRIRQEEAARERQRLKKEKAYWAKLVEGPVLELTFTPKMSVSFNPSQLFPLGEKGTVYPTLTITDKWGRMVVTGDALMHNWQRLFVSTRGLQPNDNTDNGSTIRAADWTLELAAGWTLVPGSRTGDLQLQPPR
ncbi:hypothetical protein [Paraflavitalea pollutisoli]|uniref:hypothetical protein n=1 Tax=Paraflavitalea pollutisoli TaxID=3034143 RepID=UPI0023EE0E6E|nr:hypothetical protein [Paraflavitalea sp. H1-2-19X]